MSAVRFSVLDIYFTVKGVILYFIRVFLW